MMKLSDPLSLPLTRWTARLIGICVLLQIMGTFVMYVASYTLKRWFPEDSLYHHVVWQERLLSSSLEARVRPVITLPYLVKPFDTYWSIAKVKGVSMDSVISCNNPKRPHYLSAGRTLRIPVVDGIFHQKETPRENVSSLASRYQVAKQRIAYFNPDADSSEEIFIPGVTFSLSERTRRLGYLFMKPLRSIRITSYWGMRIHPIKKKREMHTGIDLGGYEGTPVYSAKGGQVTYAGRAFGYGNLVVIRHSKRYQTKYAHLETIFVREGQVVKGQVPIGTLGNTGRSTGHHLHYEVIRDGKPINPLEVTELK